MPQPIIWLKDITEDDLPLVGTEASYLADLLSSGFPVDNGFVITTSALRQIATQNNLDTKIANILHGLDPQKPDALSHRATQINALFSRLELPQELTLAIAKAYNLANRAGPVQVTASTPPGHLPTTTALAFKLPQFTKGDANLFQALTHIWANLYTSQALLDYAHPSRHPHPTLAITVLPLKLPLVSGTIFTTNPVSGDKDTLIIEAVWGLPQKYLQGSLTPDYYQVSKSSLELRHVQLNPQATQTVLAGHELKSQSLPVRQANSPKLNSARIITLAKLGRSVSHHFFYPQQLHWYQTKSTFYITACRDYQHAASPEKAPTPTKLLANLKLVLQGNPSSPGIHTGHARIIKSTKDLHTLTPGDILVTTALTPDLLPAIKKAGAVVTNVGGQVSHAAIIARELGLPAIVGAAHATSTLKSGHLYTINAATGQVYQGAPTSHTFTAPPVNLPDQPILESSAQTATKVYAQAELKTDPVHLGQLNFDGLLLSPHALIQAGHHPHKLFEARTHHAFRQTLTDHLLEASHAFGHRPVIYQISHLSSDKLANLPHGRLFEPRELNPHLGRRGALRHLGNSRFLELELQAFREAKNQGAHNLELMFTGLRQSSEFDQLKKIAAATGLVRSAITKFWLSIDTPAAALTAADFAPTHLDGLALNLEPLASLTTGYDHTNPETSPQINLTDPALLHLVDHALASARPHRLATLAIITSSSPPHELIGHLVLRGISAITASPPNLESIRYTLHTAENKKLTRP